LQFISDLEKRGLWADGFPHRGKPDGGFIFCFPPFIEEKYTKGELISFAVISIASLHQQQRNIQIHRKPKSKS